MWWQPEERMTVHVGQLVRIEVTSGQASPVGSAGDALLLERKRVDHGKTVFVYRAIQIGNETIVAVPAGLPNDHCISCVTEHYFITVVP
jgi:hypothetical protein